MIAAITIQAYAALVTLVVVYFLILGVFFMLRAGVMKAEDKYAAKGKVYKVRGYYFWGLCVVLTVGLFWTLRYLPYEEFQAKPSEVVTVVGMQWAWKMAIGSTDVKPKDFTGENQLTLPVDTTITFQVTSEDVNHNFSIYNDRGVLLAQTQAMPGYRNDLQYRFREKGDYPILCLEYCGAPHTIMTGKIHVE